MANTHFVCLSATVHAWYHDCDFQAHECPSCHHYIFLRWPLKFVLLWYILFILLYQSNLRFGLMFFNDLLVSSCLKKPFLSLWEASIWPGGFDRKKCQFFVSLQCLGKILCWFLWCVIFSKIQFLSCALKWFFCDKICLNLSKVSANFVLAWWEFCRFRVRYYRLKSAFLGQKWRFSWGEAKMAFFEIFSWVNAYFGLI